MKPQKQILKRAKSILRLLSCLLLLCILAGCENVPIENPYPLQTESDLPVMADTEPSPAKKRVALTFDDGPQHYSERTKQIVDELTKYNFHATFFVVGNRIAGGDALSYAVNAGNEIGIHGYTHTAYYDSCAEDVYQSELSQTVEAIRAQIPGYDVKLMRPVGGFISDSRIQNCPYSVILWSVDSEDWQNTYYAGISDEEAQNKIDTIVNNVMASVSDGDIILMHDIYESTYDAVVVLLQRLNEEGYEVVTVSELLGDALQPGRAYRDTWGN